MIYVAIGTSVRTIDDKPICVTGHSTHLDPSDGIGYKHYEGREAMAKRIAFCLNACAGLTDSEVARLALAAMTTPRNPRGEMEG